VIVPDGERLIVIHSLDHARAALAASGATGIRVTLASAPGAGSYAGPAWFKAIVAIAAAEFPAQTVDAVLDCGAEAGAALASLRHGLSRIRFTGPAAVAARLSDIARQQGAVIECGAMGPAFDLADCRNPESSCRAFLAGNTIKP
jgi:hypothetical protein